VLLVPAYPLGIRAMKIRGRMKFEHTRITLLFLRLQRQRAYPWATGVPEPER